MSQPVFIVQQIVMFIPQLEVLPNLITSFRDRNLSGHSMKNRHWRTGPISYDSKQFSKCGNFPAVIWGILILEIVALQF
jgi:hypothetical protein